MNSAGQEFNRLYADVAQSIAAAIAEIGGIEVEHPQGKQELGAMMARLQVIQARFNQELDLLGEQAEWDRFTMVFFGETNAGKSTLIESLRILFREDSRQQLLQAQGHDLDRYEQALADHAATLRDGLGRLYAQYGAELTELRQRAEALARILGREDRARRRRMQWRAAALGACAGAALCAALFLLLGR